MEIRDIILSLPVMEEGEQTNVHHCKQGKGNDRLYIKRTANGHIYNCFHCGKSGGVLANGSESKKIRTYNAVPSSSNGRADNRLPRDATATWGEWHPKARAWVGRYLTIGEVRDARLLYSPSLRRVLLPVYDDSSKLVGWQARRIFDEDEGPKYVTHTASAKDFYFHFHNASTPHPCVIVEDMVSAVKVGKHCSSAALFGTTLKDGLLARLVTIHNKWLIFLDDDNPMVRASARKIKNRLDIFGEAAIISGIGKDPKECSHEELKELLT